MKMTRFALMVVLWIGLLEVTRGAGVTHYVTTNGPGPWPYTSWATAASNIQDAVNVACSNNNGDIVLVTNGTYYSRGQIILAGGSAMIVVTNAITLQSVNGPAVTILNGNLPTYTNQVFAINHSNAMVAGFTITNGNGVAGSQVNRGGGVYFSGGTLSNCWITGNAVDRGSMPGYNGGGGVYFESDGKKVLISCLIYGNTSTNSGDSGSGIHGVYNCANTLIQDCIISNNWCSNNVAVFLSGAMLVSNCTIIGHQGGSGVKLNGGNCIVDTCRIIGNQTLSGGNGGGVLNSAGKVLNSWVLNNTAGSYAGGYKAWAGGLVSNCVVSSNYAGSGGGGGLYLDYDCFVYNCTITSNCTSGTGGGVQFYRGGSSGYAGLGAAGVMRNCLISSNSASQGGGVYFQVYYNNETGTIENCTITRNYASSQGGGIYTQPGQGSETGTVINTIIYTNQCATGPDWYMNSTRKSFIYCCTTPTNSSLPGANNITNAPVFMDYAAFNFRLAPSSPCINAGTNNLNWMNNAVDLDGRPRLRYGRVDIGCYEHISKGTIFSAY